MNKIENMDIKKTSVNNLFTEVLKVTAAGFKPATPTSVVWYSIQLSYAAIIFLSECKDKAIFLFFQKSTRKCCKKDDPTQLKQSLTVFYPNLLLLLLL